MNFTIPAEQPAKRSDRKKDLYRLLVARSDVLAAREACELMLKVAPAFGDPLYVPLLSAIVVCYARPFTRNRPLGALPEKWRTFPDQRMQQMHDALYKARSELIAHSDMNARQAKIVPPGFVLSEGGREMRSEGIGVQVTFYYFTLPMLRSVPALAHDLARRLGSEIDRLVEELYGGMTLPNAPFALRIDDEGL